MMPLHSRYHGDGCRYTVDSSLHVAGKLCPVREDECHECTTGDRAMCFADSPDRACGSLEDGSERAALGGLIAITKCGCDVCRYGFITYALTMEVDGMWRDVEVGDCHGVGPEDEVEWCGCEACVTAGHSGEAVLTGRRRVI